MSLLSKIDNKETVPSPNGQPCLIVAEYSHAVKVLAGESGQIIIIARGKESEVNITLGEGSSVDIIQRHEVGSSTRINITAQESSSLNLLTIHLNDSSSSIKVDMVGKGAECRVNALQLQSGQEHSSVDITTTHSVGCCKSSVDSRILVSGESRAELTARAIVCDGAQQSIANQTLRAIELNDGASAKVLPELEIYADDVKCSHGATMGQIDSDAILYMRQRGLSLEQARKLQMEGFIADVVRSVSIESIDEVVNSAINLKFSEL